MKKVLLTIIVFLLTASSSMMFSQNEFEYVYEDGVGVGDYIKITDVFEKGNGDYVIFGYVGNSMYFGRLSETGELLSETTFDNYVPGYNPYNTEGAPIVRDSNGNFYTFLVLNPLLDANNMGYFDSKIVMNKLNENLEVVYSKEMIIPLDTTNLWNESGSIYSYPMIEIGTVLDKGDGFVICYEKYQAETGAPNNHDDTFDSTFLIKTDYELNILKSGSIEHPVCNSMRHRNHLLYDESDDEYLYYVSYNWLYGNNKKGVYLYRFDSGFNYIDEHYMFNTDGTGMHTIKYRDSDGSAGGITLKRTSSNTTIMMAGADCYHVTNGNPPTDDYTAAVCLVMDDEAKMLDSITFGRAETSPGNRTSVPFACSIDWVDESRIFIAATPNSFFADMLYNNEYQYLVVKMIDKDLNILDELYYDFGETSSLWTTTLKATKDGGCMIAGHYKDFGKDPDEDIYYNFIKKFPPEAFVGIEEPHAHGLKVAVAYPNPGGDVMNIRTTLRNCNLTVYDMQGRIVHQQEITDDVTSIDASNWQSGTYIWKLKTENGKLKVEEGKWVK